MQASHPPGVRVPVVSDEGLTFSTGVGYALLRQDFQFVGLQSEGVRPETLYPKGPFLLVYTESICEFVEQFQFLTCADLRVIAQAHGLRFKTRYRHSSLLELLRNHCACRCDATYLLFKQLMRARRNVRVLRHHPPLPPETVAAAERGHGADAQRQVRAAETEEHSDLRHLADSRSHRDHRQQVRMSVSEHTEPTRFPQNISFDQKKQIIREWQERMEPENFVESVCAVCAWSFPRKTLMKIVPTQPMLHVLRNEYLPAHVLPNTYDFEVYGHAILCPAGLTELQSIGEIFVCSACNCALRAKPPRLPKYALANFLYYGRDRLPDEVHHAFASASPFEL
ncbi:hypothetical protein V8E55_009248 [Tylopilus felleus]